MPKTPGTPSTQHRSALVGTRVPRAPAARDEHPGNSGPTEVTDEQLRLVAHYLEDQGAPELGGGYFPRDTTWRERGLLLVARLLLVTACVATFNAFTDSGHKKLWGSVMAVTVLLGTLARVRRKELRIARKGPGAGRRPLQRVLWLSLHLPEALLVIGLMYAALVDYILPADPTYRDPFDLAMVVVLMVYAVNRLFTRRFATASVAALVVSTSKAALRGILTSPRAATTIPVMLSVIAFLFISGDAWKLFGRMEPWRFGMVVAVMSVLTVLIIRRRLPEQLRTLHEVPDDVEALARSTPAVVLVEDCGVVPCTTKCAVTPRIRFSLVAPVWFALIARVFAAAGMLGGVLLVSGILFINEPLTIDLVSPGTTPLHSIPGTQLVVSVALLQVVVGLSMLAALYFAAVSLADGPTQKAFLEDEPVRRVYQVLAAWAYFEGAMAVRRPLFVLRGMPVYRHDLRGMDFRGADLSTADLTAADVRGAEADHRTRWPGGTIPPGVRMRRASLFH